MLEGGAAAVSTGGEERVKCEKGTVSLFFGVFFRFYIFLAPSAALAIRVLCALLSPQRLRLPEGAHRWHGVARAATVGARPKSKPYGRNLLE